MLVFCGGMCVCVLVFGSWLVLEDVPAWVCGCVCACLLFVCVALCLWTCFVATKVHAKTLVPFPRPDPAVRQPAGQLPVGQPLARALSRAAPAVDPGRSLGVYLSG